MRSSSGQHFPGLDHIRAVAAFLVVLWHFAHGSTGVPVQFNESPEIGLLDEGHVGVSLFMVLSGYLFAKLIGDRAVDYRGFLWNRALRLLPLLIVVIGLVWVRDGLADPAAFAMRIVSGLVLPVLPNGGWSITAEAHFYLIFPALVWLSRKWRFAPLAVVVVAVCFRGALYASGWNVQDAAYWTIIGRIDQFALGMLFSGMVLSRSWAVAAVVAITVAYALFDLAGGFYSGPDWVWIGLPLLEAVTFGMIISWYDANPIRSPKMWLVERAGEYSYSIYLLHFFFVFSAAKAVDLYVMPIDNLYVAIPWAILFFGFMIAVGSVSFAAIEKPALRYRKSYMRSRATTTEQPSATRGYTSGSTSPESR